MRNVNENVWNENEILSFEFLDPNAADVAKGALYVPDEVTLARQAGEEVAFVTDCCGPNCWYWLKSDGTRIFHYDPLTYHRIGIANHREEASDDKGSYFEGGAGPCPKCGNPYTGGNIIKSAL